MNTEPLIRPKEECVVVSYCPLCENTERCRYLKRVGTGTHHSSMEMPSGLDVLAQLPSMSRFLDRPLSNIPYQAAVEMPRQ